MSYCIPYEKSQHIKTILRHHLSLTELLKTKSGKNKTKQNSANKGVREEAFTYIARENINWYKFYRG